jgi:hypothetical protein
MALSRITPSQVEILEISTQAGNFLIRGRCDAGIAGPDGLLEGFRRDLGFEGAPWSLTWDPAGPHGQEFVWHGAFH